MRHRPLLAKSTRSALSRQGNPGSGTSCSHSTQQQWRQTSTVRSGSKAIREHGSHDVDAPRKTPSHSKSSIKIPVHGRQRYDDDAGDDFKERSCLLRINPQPTSTVYTTAILSYLRKQFGSVLEFTRLDKTNPKSPASPAGNAYRTTFTQPKSRAKALHAPPLTLHIDAHGIAREVSSSTGDATATSSLPTAPASTPSQSSPSDPYNVFGLKDRHLPTPCTFTCTFQRHAPDPSFTDLSGTTMSSSSSARRPALLSHKHFEAEKESLIASGLSESLAAVFALRPGEVPLEQEPGETGSGSKLFPRGDVPEKDLWFARKQGSTGVVGKGSRR